MLGKPKYTRGLNVEFYLEGKRYKGDIYIIDSYGTFEDDSNVSYDVMVNNYGENNDQECLFKHLNERMLLHKLDKELTSLDRFDEILFNANKRMIQRPIVEDLYNKINSWITYNDENWYLIGLSENKYDYYYILINNKSRELKFLSCAINIEQNPKSTYQFNWDERKHINEEVEKYFSTHVNEKLIYLSV